MSRICLWIVLSSGDLRRTTRIHHCTGYTKMVWSLFEPVETRKIGVSSFSAI